MNFLRKITALLLTAAFCCFSFAALTATAEGENGETEEIVYDMTDAIDDCADFETVYAVSDGIILDHADEDNLTAFEGDYTFFQRNTSLDEWVIYKVPTGKQLEFVTYFWLGEEMVHFKFEYSEDGENWKNTYPAIDAKAPQAGKWTPVSYTLDTLPEEALYVRVTFQNLNGVSWSPCIANVRAHSSDGSNAVFTDTIGLPCEKAATVLKYLGLVNGYTDTEFAPEKSITRAEFCSMSVKFLDLSTNGVTHSFTDVDKSHWAAEYISTIAAQGYINGLGDGRFEPDSEITLNQAVKILVSMLGYSPLALSGGGYPMGYNLMGSRLDLFRDISLTGENAITRGDAAILFKNATEAELMRQSEYGDNNIFSYDGSTVLNVYHNIYTVKGVVTDIGARSVTGANVLSEDKILVGDNEYYIKDFNPEELLGLNATLYVKYDSDTGEGTLVYAYSDDKVVKIDYNDFLDYDGKTISYIDKSGSERTVGLNPNTRIVYNGRYLTRAGVSKELDFKCGSITLINNGGGSSVNIIMVEDYDTYFVTSDSKLVNSLYDKFRGAVKISLENAEKTDVIKNGKYVEYDEEMVIPRDNTVHILQSADGLVAKVIISGKYIKGEVSTIQNDNYMIDGRWYSLSKYFKDSGQELGVGSGEITVYLDTNGNIVTTDSDSGDMQYGYIQAIAETGGILNEVKMRLITPSGAAEEYIADSRTSVNGVKREVEKLKMLPNQLIRYKIRKSDNMISQIETAYQNIGGVFQTDAFSLDYKSDRAILRGGELNTLNGIYQLDNDTKVFYIPTDESDAAKYKTGGKALLNADFNYKIEAFDLDRDYTLGAVVVYENGSDDEGLNYSSKVMVVSEVYTHYDEYGEFYLSAEGFSGGNKTEITFDSDGAEDYSAGWNSSGRGHSTIAGETDVIKRGDVIQYSLDSDGKCKSVRFLYLAGQEGLFEKNGADYGVLSDENYYSELYVGIGTVKLKTASKIMYSTNAGGEPLRTLPCSNTSFYIYSIKNDTLIKAELADVSYDDKIFVRMNYSNTNEIMIIR